MIGTYRHRVTLDNPGPAVPDGAGGFTATSVPLDPAVWDCSIVPATASDVEAIGGGTVTASASHVVRGRYHPGITSQTRVRFGSGRTLNVVGVANRAERNIETVLMCAEVIA